MQSNENGSIAFILAGVLFVTLMRVPGLDFIGIETTRIAINCILFAAVCENKILRRLILAMPLMVAYSVVPDKIVTPIVILGNYVRYGILISILIILAFRKRILA